MATPQMKAQEGALRRAANMVNEAHGDFTKLSSNLMNQIDSQAAGWQGAGGSAFHTLHLQWQEKQKKIVDALNHFETALTHTDQKNTSTDHDQHGKVNSVANMLNNSPTGPQ